MVSEETRRLLPRGKMWSNRNEVVEAGVDSTTSKMTGDGGGGGAGNEVLKCTLGHLSLLSAT